MSEGQVNEIQEEQAIHGPSVVVLAQMRVLFTQHSDDILVLAIELIILNETFHKDYNIHGNVRKEPHSNGTGMIKAQAHWHRQQAVIVDQADCGHDNASVE